MRHVKNLEWKESRLELSPSTFLAENWIILACRHLWKWKQLPAALSSHSRPAQRIWLIANANVQGFGSALSWELVSRPRRILWWLCQAHETSLYIPSLYRWRGSFVFTLWKHQLQHAKAFAAAHVAPSSIVLAGSGLCKVDKNCFGIRFWNLRPKSSGILEVLSNQVRPCETCNKQPHGQRQLATCLPLTQCLCMLETSSDAISLAFFPCKAGRTCLLSMLCLRIFKPNRRRKGNAGRLQERQCWQAYSHAFLAILFQEVAPFLFVQVWL